MKHYTFSLLTLSLITLFSLSSLSAKKSSYTIYDNCEEYYDSRGFYHRDCKKNKFDKRKLKRAYRTLSSEFEPGTGEEDNSTNNQVQAPSTPSSAIDDIIDDTQLDESSTNEQESFSETPALSEEPTLEFGREDP